MINGTHGTNNDRDSGDGMGEEMDDAVSLRPGKNYQIAMRALRSVTARRVAELTGISDTTISDFVAKGAFERACQILDASGLKLVKKDAKVQSDATMERLRYFAKLGVDVDISDTGYGDDL